MAGNLRWTVHLYCLGLIVGWKLSKLDSMWPLQLRRWANFMVIVLASAPFKRIPAGEFIPYLLLSTHIIVNAFEFNSWYFHGLVSMDAVMLIFGKHMFHVCGCRLNLLLHGEGMTIAVTDKLMMISFFSLGRMCYIVLIPEIILA